MNNDLYTMEKRIIDLEYELQQQKGMLWLLGEIIKAATNISSFEELMKVLTDMLMGVTGVNSCYLWMEDRKQNLRVYCRSTEFKNEFRELEKDKIPHFIHSLGTTYEFEKEEIIEPLTPGMGIPASRLVVPLLDGHNNETIGGLVLEHCISNFFKPSNIIFFETLAIFIASNTTNSRLFEDVAEASETDALTGIFNRRYLIKRMNMITRTHKVMCVAIFDTDNFKLVNDFLGHTKGDELLRSIAQAAQSYFKKYDGEVIRYGGDEFVILLPGSINEAMVLLETFKQSVPSLPVIKKEEVPVTITIGVCEYPTMTKDVMMVLEVADHALIRGKNSGKNKVVRAGKEDFEILRYYANCKCKDYQM